MHSFSHHVLSLLIFLPTAGMLFVMTARSLNIARWTTLATTLLAFALSLVPVFMFDRHEPADGSLAAYAVRDALHPAGVVQLVQHVNVGIGVYFHFVIGIDGLSLPLVLLTTLICVLVCLASWRLATADKGYFACCLFLESLSLGTFLSLDLILFFAFFQAFAATMCLLIGRWGGERRQAAAIKLSFFMLLSAIAMLIAIIGIHRYGGSFDLIALPERLAEKCSAGGALYQPGKILFLLLMGAFLIRLPVAPFHAWLAGAHAAASTPVSMLLSSLMLAGGGYGVLRIAYPLFGAAAQSLWALFAVMGIVTLLYGALCAMAQDDLKRLAAFNSVSQAGWVLLGTAMMTPAALHGASFILVANGISGAMLFYLVGIIVDRAQHGDLSRLGGMRATLPVLWSFSAVAVAAATAIPGFCGMIGPYLVLIGIFQAAPPDSAISAAGPVHGGMICTLLILGGVAILLTAACTLWTLQRIFFGPAREECRAMRDVESREVGVLTPLAVMAFLLGAFPTPTLFNFTQTTMHAMFRFDPAPSGAIANIAARAGSQSRPSSE